MDKKEKKERQTQTNTVIRAMNVLEVLKEHTDKNHRCTQQEILELLQEKDDHCTEKTLASSLKWWMEYYNPAEYDEETKEQFKILYDGIENGRGRKSNIYYVHDFSNDELDEMIEALKFSKTLDNQRANYLIEKIKRYGSPFYDKAISSIQNVPENSSIDKVVLAENLWKIQTAIVDNVKISFLFNGYDRNGKLVPVRERRYLISPYYIVAYNGKYYTIANTDSHDNVSFYRIDLMTDIQIPERSEQKKGVQRKNIRMIEGMPGNFQPEVFMREHMNMHYDIPGTITLQVNAKRGYTVLHEWFGKNLSL